MSEQLNAGRRLARRRMAYGAYGLLWSFALLSMMILFFSEDRKAFAEALAVAAPAIMMIAVGPLTLILLAYLGVSVGERAVDTIWGKRDP